MQLVLGNSPNMQLRLLGFYQWMATWSMVLACIFRKKNWKSRGLDFDPQRI